MVLLDRYALLIDEISQNTLPRDDNQWPIDEVLPPSEEVSHRTFKRLACLWVHMHLIRFLTQMVLLRRTELLTLENGWHLLRT